MFVMWIILKLCLTVSQSGSMAERKEISTQGIIETVARHLKAGTVTTVRSILAHVTYTIRTTTADRRDVAIPIMDIHHHSTVTCLCI
ncbi:unnamed protein product [Angiostrongylus costaricensis]|uniref:Secreted protein n=1 Tax=Angiostrongylus costaricensis TaxID=334426 RepID=A0A0R3PK00_ANGCS|nr:unnamed protein product [Angiostrongylus costaricensis]